jgi:hypothetical protein
MREEEKKKLRKQEEEKNIRESRRFIEAHYIYYRKEQKVHCFEVSQAVFARLSGNGRLGTV